MVIEERTPDDAELADLLAAAFGELVAKYGAEGRSLVGGDARYLVACVDGAAVGCGAVQAAGEGVSELKRMYVRPEARGRGVAKALLTALERLAGQAGGRTLRLATGERQPEAIAMYEKYGYVRSDPYGKYVAQPLTRCYEKRLPAAA